MTYLDTDWWKAFCRKLVASMKRACCEKYYDLLEEGAFAATLLV